MLFKKKKPKQWNKENNTTEGSKVRINTKPYSRNNKPRFKYIELIQILS
jgi:predicted HNH restriction endonuclease